MAIPRDGRVVTPDFTPREALQPAPIPGSTYVRPAQTQQIGMSHYEAIAQALGNFSAGLRTYANEKAQEEQKKQEDAYMADFMLKPREEQQRLIREGKVPRLYADQTAAVWGAGTANDFNNGIEGWLNEAPPEGMSQEQYIEQKRREFAAGLPKGPAQSAFVKLTQPNLEQANASIAKRRTDVAAEALADKYLGYMREVVNKEGKGDPEATITKLAAHMKVLVDDRKAIDGKQANAYWMRLAEEWAAEGRFDLIDELRRNDRLGVGALGNSAEHGLQLDKLSSQAREKYNEKNIVGITPLLSEIDQKVARGEFTMEEMNKMRNRPELRGVGDEKFSTWFRQSAENAESLRQKKALIDAASDQKARISQEDLMKWYQGKLILDDIEDEEITLPDGTTKTYSGADRKRTVLELRAAQIDRMAEDKGWSPETKMMLTLREFESNRTVNPAWKSQLKNISGRASQMAAAEGDMTEIHAAVELYRMMENNNPGYAEMYDLSDEDKAFLENAKIAIESGADPRQAAAFGAKAVEDVIKGTNQYFHIKDEVIEKQVQYQTGSSTNFDASVLADISDLAKFRMKYLREDERTAVQKAGERFYATHVEINGRFVFAGYENMPKDFKPRAEQYMQDVVKAKGEVLPSDNWKDYTITTIDGGRTYAMFYNGMPVIASEGDRDDRASREGLLTFNLKELSDHARIKRDAELGKMVDDANKGRTADEQSFFQGVPGVDPVGEFAYSNDRERDIDVLTRTVIGEAAAEGETGQAAVAWTIINRSNDNRFPEKLADVALQRNEKGYYQFSTWASASKGGNNLPKTVKKDSATYKRVRAVVEDVLAGRIPDPTGGAVNYYAYNTMGPPRWWDMVKAERGGTFVRIGNHKFAGLSKRDRKKTEVASN